MSLFLRWEIKSWESCLVIRRVLSHAQQYALIPNCLCRDCASQWMGEWKIWEKGKTLALSQVGRSNDDFCQGVFVRRNLTQKNFMNAKGMLTRVARFSNNWTEYLPELARQKKFFKPFWLLIYRNISGIYLEILSVACCGPRSYWKLSQLQLCTSFL